MGTSYRWYSIVCAPISKAGTWYDVPALLIGYRFTCLLRGWYSCGTNGWYWYMHATTPFEAHKVHSHSTWNLKSNCWTRKNMMLYEVSSCVKQLKCHDDCLSANLIWLLPEGRFNLLFRINAFSALTNAFWFSKNLKFKKNKQNFWQAGYSSLNYGAICSSMTKTIHPGISITRIFILKWARDNH
jgi:hypothetical protein